MEKGQENYSKYLHQLSQEAPAHHTLCHWHDYATRKENATIQNNRKHWPSEHTFHRQTYTSEGNWFYFVWYRLN